MLGPALISAALALSLEPEPLLLTLPLEEIACLERDLPPPPRPLGRVCLEIDGVAGPACMPDMPVPLPAHTEGSVLRVFAATHRANLWLPVTEEAEPPELEAGPRDGHALQLEEPPRSV
jgi:hypothetical protein